MNGRRRKTRVLSSDPRFLAADNYTQISMLWERHLPNRYLLNTLFAFFRCRGVGIGASARPKTGSEISFPGRPGHPSRGACAAQFLPGHPDASGRVCAPTVAFWVAPVGAFPARAVPGSDVTGPSRHLLGRAGQPQSAKLKFDSARAPLGFALSNDSLLPRLNIVVQRLEARSAEHIL